MQNFGGVNVWRMNLEMHLNGKILAVEHIAGCCVLQCDTFG